jgi:hypothetical protein
MRLALLLAFSVVLLGCKVQFNSGSGEQVEAREGSTSEQAATKAAATVILAQLDAEQWDKAWSSGASSLKQTTTQTGFTSGVRASRAMFGTPPASRDITGFAFPESIEGAPPGQYGIVFYTADFSKAQDVEEQVVLRKDGDEWRLAGYWAEKRKQVKLL